MASSSGEDAFQVVESPDTDPASSIQCSVSVVEPQGFLEMSPIPDEHVQNIEYHCIPRTTQVITETGTHVPTQAASGTLVPEQPPVQVLSGTQPPKSQLPPSSRIRPTLPSTITLVPVAHNTNTSGVQSVAHSLATQTFTELPVPFAQTLQLQPLTGMYPVAVLESRTPASQTPVTRTSGGVMTSVADIGMISSLTDAEPRECKIEAASLYEPEEGELVWARGGASVPCGNSEGSSAGEKWEELCEEVRLLSQQLSAGDRYSTAHPALSRLSSILEMAIDQFFVGVTLKNLTLHLAMEDQTAQILLPLRALLANLAGQTDASPPQGVTTLTTPTVKQEAPIAGVGDGQNAHEQQTNDVEDVHTVLPKSEASSLQDADTKATGPPLVGYRPIQQATAETRDDTFKRTVAGDNSAHGSSVLNKNDTFTSGEDEMSDNSDSGGPLVLPTKRPRVEDGNYLPPPMKRSHTKDTASLPPPPPRRRSPRARKAKPPQRGSSPPTPAPAPDDGCIPILPGPSPKGARPAPVRRQRGVSARAPGKKRQFASPRYSAPRMRKAKDGSQKFISYKSHCCFICHFRSGETSPPAPFPSYTDMVDHVLDAHVTSAGLHVRLACPAACGEEFSTETCRDAFIKTARCSARYKTKYLLVRLLRHLTPGRAEESPVAALQAARCHNWPVPPYVVQHPCPQCPLTNLTASGLAGHMRTQHTAGAAVRKPDAANTTMMACDLCGKVMQRHSLREHVPRCGRSVESRKAECPVCHKRVVRLGFHIQNMHSGAEHHLCHVCSQSFKQPKSLELHLINKHGVNDTGREVMLCDKCDFKCASKQDLKTHTETRHVYVTCPKCPAVILKPDLTAHLKGVHVTPHIPCHVCGLNFKTMSSMENHVTNVHSGRRYKCEWCDMETPYATYLKKHMGERCPNRPPDAMNAAFKDKRSVNKRKVAAMERTVTARFIRIN